MAGETKHVGAFDAKTHLSELLREAERGNSVVIRRRGRAVARLVPAAEEAAAPSALAEAFRAVRKRIGGKFDVRLLIDEGRR